MIVQSAPAVRTVEDVIATRATGASARPGGASQVSPLDHVRPRRNLVNTRSIAILALIIAVLLVLFLFVF